MHETKEIRWIFKSNIKHVHDWFNGLNAATSETRVDYYLKSRNQNLGVKLREGKVEIKQRVGTRAKGYLNPNLWGHYDSFIKWTFDASDNDPVFLKVLDGDFDQWIPIQKERNLVQVARKNEDIVLESVYSHVPNGCQVEYSKIQFCDTTWYTVGLEWFGKRCLNLESDLISDIFGNTKLSMQQSQGYSDFLDKHKVTLPSKLVFPRDFSAN